MLKPTIPSPAEARALMTGAGACEEDIERNGCNRTARVVAGMTPEQRKAAPPSYRKACDDHDEMHAFTI